MRPLFPLLLFTLAAPLLRAQDADEETAPTGRLLGQPPDSCQWVIKYTYPQKKPDSGSTAPAGGTDPAGSPGAAAGFVSIQSAAAASTPSETTITKTHNFIHEVMVDTGGNRTERWSDGGLEAVLSPGSSQPYINGTTVEDPSIVNFSRQYFDGFDWISLQNYIGVKKWKDEPCFVFQQGSDDKPTLAYLDVKTHLPVRLETPTETRDYSFSPPDVAEQTFPDSVLRILKQVSDTHQALSRFGAHP